MAEFEDRVRALIGAGDIAQATTLVLQKHGPETFGFLAGVVGQRDADDVFSAFAERVWRALADFEWRCALRTWCYVLARHELGRFLRGKRRRDARCAPLANFEELLEAARSASRSTFATKRDKLSTLRDTLPPDERTLLILRVDRNLSWDEIALTFADPGGSIDAEELKRLAARLRKRFQLLKQRLKRHLIAPGDPESLPPPAS